MLFLEMIAAIILYGLGVSQLSRIHPLLAFRLLLKVKAAALSGSMRLDSQHPRQHDVTAGWRYWLAP